MKYMILVMLLLFLAGCSKAPLQCDYSTFIEQNNNLMTQNIACQNDKTTCTSDLATSKSVNNQLQLQILNNSTLTSCVQTDCTTMVRLYGECETRLEDCWLNSNQTITVVNHTWYNQTLIDLYNNCSATLNLINESLN